MNKPKVIYRVDINVSHYYKLSFVFDDIRDAQYLTDALLLNLDKERSDSAVFAIYPEVPEEKEAEVPEAEEPETEVAGNE